MREESYIPFVLICCEGEQTEPQYFNIVIRQRRIKERARVKVIGDKGQHKTLIDEAVLERNKVCQALSLDPEDVEAWAVCDKDQMPYSLAELEGHASKNNIKLAFSDPKFEIFLLQHLSRSATNLNGSQLDRLISKGLQRKGEKSAYDKTDLGSFGRLFDTEPLLLETAITNSHAVLSNKENTPYTTVHLLLARLLEMAP